MSNKKQAQAEALKSILQQLSSGASVEDVREEFRKTFDTVEASEIAAAEAELIKTGTPIEEIQQLCNVHASLVEGSVEVIAADPVMGHPLTVFYKENDGLEEFLAGTYAEAKADFLSSKDNKLYLKALYELYKLDRHYSRKEQLMFPYLEKNGITAPPKVMWGKDDEIRGLIKQAIAKAEAGEYDEALFTEMESEVRGMIQKENEILKPMLVDNINDEGWKVIAQEGYQFGYAFIDGVEGVSPSDIKAWVKDEQDLDQRRGSNDIDLPSGYFNVHELEALLNTLPYDITFVNADDRVQYFSENEHRVFPRTRTVLGRLVEDCHPPKSLHVVDSIVKDFKSGKKDKEFFWIQKDGQFIMIRFYAIRDAEGKYLGVRRIKKKISELRRLGGSKAMVPDN